MIRVLYIEGFSPGPGLPQPLLSSDHFEVITARMPYGCNDHIVNPFGWLLLISVVLTIYFFSETVGQQAWWVTLLVVIGGGGVIYMCKLAAVGFCLDACIRQYRSTIVATAPDVVLGYSWGGGIACSLLAKGFWTGPTILIAPAGNQMNRHAGRTDPSLKDGCIPASATVLVVQGDSDGIVTLQETEHLVANSSKERVRFIVGRREDHFLRRTITTSTLVQWCNELLQGRRAAGAEDGEEEGSLAYR